MIKGICEYFGVKAPMKERLYKIKEYGFDAIITSADKKFDKTNGKFRKRVNYAKKIGLKLSSLHSSYDHESFNLFLDNKIGNKVAKKLIKEVKMCSKYGFLCLVVHLYGEPSEVGIDRINRILKVCDKYNVDLAIENILYPHVFDYVFKNIKHDHLKMCYDSGHNNCFEKGREFFPEFNKKLVCLHLHDNFGEKDDHMPFNLGGQVNIDKVAKDLINTKVVNLDFEILCHNKVLTTIDEILSKTMENAKYIEAIVEKERKKLQSNC